MLSTSPPTHSKRALPFAFLTPLRCGIPVRRLSTAWLLRRKCWGVQVWMSFLPLTWGKVRDLKTRSVLWERAFPDWVLTARRRRRGLLLAMHPERRRRRR